MDQHALLGPLAALSRALCQEQDEATLLRACVDTLAQLTGAVAAWYVGFSESGELKSAAEAEVVSSEAIEEAGGLPRDRERLLSLARRAVGERTEVGELWKAPSERGCACTAVPLPDLRAAVVLAQEPEQEGLAKGQPGREHAVTVVFNLLAAWRRSDELKKAHAELLRRHQNAQEEHARVEAIAEELCADLDAAVKELQRSNEELDQFAHVVSHDLQEPLRKVLAFGERLETKFNDALGEEGNEYLRRMIRASHRMQALIRDLLAFARISTQAREFEPVTLAPLLEEVLEDLELRVGQTKAQVVVAELPSVEGDPVQLRQLFHNLVGNALKFSKPDEPPRVEVRAEQNDGRSRIVISDHGIGFDDRYGDRIFGVFERLHDRNSRYEGTGIGLALCKKIVQRHGGTISAHGRPGEGARFVFDLPLSESPL